MMKKYTLLFAMSVLLLICSCSKLGKRIPAVEPKYRTTYDDLINKVAENDSVSMGFEQSTTSNLIEKKTTRRLVFYIDSKLEKSQINEKYLQERDEKIRKFAIKDITNIGEFDSIESIYTTKNGEEIKSEIIVDKLKK